MNLEEQLLSGQILKKENLSFVLLLITIIVLLSAAIVAEVEPSFTFPDALWWSIVTLTTVGYGDLAPKTLLGRLIAVVIMILGIGLLTTASITISAIVASTLINRRLKEEQGMNSYQFENHIIFCEWNYRVRSILLQFRSTPATKNTPIVLISDTERRPIEDRNLFFIRGGVTDETLQRANIQQASTVIILGDDRLDPEARDAKVVLSTLTVESLNPHVYTIVELSDQRYLQHCQRANADEIIVRSDLSAMLICQAALNHGISRLFNELLSPAIGNHTYITPVPPELVGKTVLESMPILKATRNSTLIGIQTATGEVLCNPDCDYCLHPQDHLVLIMKEFQSPGGHNL
ncbi:MAG: ion channel [Pseudanabaenaceae cyanobacterium SKYGB_i_bin29]|nr:ion channel [Pseudanabaenaceae cyanobacterium SKYG29]MDW8421928.1 ion channel [Pseudanabaenaceae cyanobacterium SKYGB_i_bin29]